MIFIVIKSLIIGFIGGAAIAAGAHVGWFRRKRDEFREAIGIPKTKQNRGIKY